VPTERSFIPLLVAISITSCAPRKEPDPPYKAPPVAPSAEVDPQALAALKALIPRQACNRVTGCPGLTALAQHGEKVLEPARLALLTPGKPEGFWVLALIELLGTLGEPEATHILVPLLDDKRWETRIAAARALGLMGAHILPSGREALATHLASPNLDPTFHAALAFASWRTAPPSASAPHRETLLTLLPRSAEAVAATAHPQLDIFVRLVGDARLPEALPTVRFAMLSGNRFVHITALDVAGLLQDSGAIPYALALLNNPNPTVRKESIRALQRITGAQLDTADTWLAWGRQHGLEPAKSPVSQSGNGGSSSPLGTDQGPDGP
jgi:HEAT repeat protein